MARADFTALRTGFSVANPLVSANAAGTVATLALAAFVTAVPVFIHLANQAFAVIICCSLAALIAIYAATTVPAILIFSFVFQNAFVAVVSPQLVSVDQFNAIRAYNFISTAVVWMVIVGQYWMARSAVDARLRSLMRMTTLALIGIGFYFCLGLATDPVGATIYLRNICTPFLLFQIFTLVAYRNRVVLASALVVIAFATLLFGYIEFFADEKFFELINGEAYLKWAMMQQYESGSWLNELHTAGRVIRSHLDATTIDFLNTSLLGEFGLRFHRLLGPNFHSISFAYGLAFFAVVLSALGQWWCVILAIPLLLVIGSKGALIFTVMVILTLLLATRVRSAWLLWGYQTLLVLYIAVTIDTGIRVEDYHVIGLIGGLNGFLSNPLGHGIGLGGNLTLGATTTIDWARAQQLGTTGIAVESAIGVLLFQMGIAGACLLALLFWIARKCWKLYTQSGNRLFAVAALGLLSIMANGFFQEEALFAPLALGPVLALAGLLLGRAYRPSETAICSMRLR